MAAGTRLRINIPCSQFLKDYISSYPNVLGISDSGPDYFYVDTTMTSTQITQFKNDVLNHCIEIQ